MCSLSYIPTNEGFILTHNRDELPQRESSSGLIRNEYGNRKLVFPQDLSAGGTWMGADDSGLGACLLNGGSVSYLRRLPYKASRGTVIPELLQKGNLSEFRNSWQGQGIEPFTLIIVEMGRLWQLSHDPHHDTWKELDPEEPHFWSSTKLYHPQIQQARENRFKNWLQDQAQDKISAKNVAAFHLSKQIDELKGGLTLPENFPLKTVSFCQLDSKMGNLNFTYHYLLKDQSDEQNW